MALSAVPARAFPAVRSSGRRYIPCLPTLAPALLSPMRRAARLPFPFAERRAERYYFARNAVYHGVQLLGLAGQEVLVPAYHHGVEIAALLAAGCVPRFVRVDGHMRLDVEDLEAQIGPRTRALYVIHYAGFPQPMEAIAALARARGLSIVEDCALSLLSCDGERPLGSHGDISVFCLYKTIPVPNGGMLVVNGAAADGVPPKRPAPLASTLSHAAGSLLSHAALRFGDAGQALRDALRSVARLRFAAGLRHVSTGTAEFDPAQVDLAMSRLSTFIARNLDFQAIVAARRRNFFLLLGRLRDAAPPIFPTLPAGVCPLFYPLLCSDKAAVAERLAERGIDTVDFWRHGHPSCPRERYPEVDGLRRRVLELPVHQDLGPEDMAYVADAVRECLS